MTWAAGCDGLAFLLHRKIRCCRRALPCRAVSCYTNKHRTDSSYARWEEALKTWNEVRSLSKDLARQVRGGCVSKVVLLPPVCCAFTVFVLLSPVSCCVFSVTKAVHRTLLAVLCTTLSALLRLFLAVTVNDCTCCPSLRPATIANCHSHRAATGLVRLRARRCSSAGQRPSAGHCWCIAGGRGGGRGH